MRGMIDHGPRSVQWDRREVVLVEEEDDNENENTAVGAAVIISEMRLLENPLVKNAGV